jgi:hypothetical protein
MADRLLMTDYNAMKQTAVFAFITAQGKSSDIRIHLNTFKMLMSDTWDIDAFGEPPADILSFKDEVRSIVKKDYLKWFETEANQIMYREANSAQVSKNS